MQKYESLGTKKKRFETIAMWKKPYNFVGRTIKARNLVHCVERQCETGVSDHLLST